MHAGHSWDHEWCVKALRWLKALCSTASSTTEPQWLTSPDPPLLLAGWESTFWLVWARHRLQEGHVVGFILPSTDRIPLDTNTTTWTKILAFSICYADTFYPVTLLQSLHQIHCLHWLHVLDCVWSIGEFSTIMVRDRAPQREIWPSIPPWENHKPRPHLVLLCLMFI